MKILAPAKLNLFLHLTGRRDDHFHLLESLFVFTTLGDTLTIMPDRELRFSLHGPFGKVLAHSDLSKNLIVRAANLLRETYSVQLGALIQLSKHIPIGAGLGGGSSDAAATLIGLNRLWKLNLDIRTLSHLALTLGADVPACLYRQPVFVSGIGEIISPVALPFKTSPVLLIKPNQSLTTTHVFQYFKNQGFPFSSTLTAPCFSKDWNAFIDFLSVQKNDLEMSATHFLPVIHALLDYLKTKTTCRLARMSGSGPTCFALFDDFITAKEAWLAMQKLFPGFWMGMTHVAWDEIR